MTIDMTVSIATLIALVISLLAISKRFGALELKVNTMWDFQIRRAFAEANKTGMGKMDSPLVFTPDALTVIESMKDDLVQLYEDRRTKKKMRDAEILLEIEREYGDRLLHDVCLPYRLSHGACLLLALSVAKQTNTLDNLDITNSTEILSNETNKAN